jgi:hypothetical protein
LAWCLEVANNERAENGAWRFAVTSIYVAVHRLAVEDIRPKEIGGA